jgi:hypothetical protein
MGSFHVLVMSMLSLFSGGRAEQFQTRFYCSPVGCNVVEMLTMRTGCEVERLSEQPR